MMASQNEVSAAGGLKFHRRFTKDDVNVYDQFEYDYRVSVIRNPNGEIVFRVLFHAYFRDYHIFQWFYGVYQ